MALQFDSGPYLELFRLRQAQEQANRPDITRDVTQPLLQGLQLLQQNKQQNALLYLQKQKQLYEQGDPSVLENKSVGAPVPGVTPRLFSKSGPALQPTAGQMGTGMPLRDAFNAWQANNMKGPMEPEYPTALGSLGRGEYREQQKIDIDRMKAEHPQTDISFQKTEYTDAQGRTRIGAWNPRSGQIIKSPTDEYAPQTARGETAGNLRKEFIDRPEVKEFVTISTQVKSMDALLKNALAGNMNNQLALDQSLITMYNKLTDPASVVRESEYARTPENIPVVNRISGAIDKLAQGGAGLTNEDRKALVLGAKIIANERGGVFSQRRGEYENLAGKMQIDPSLVTGTIADFTPYDVNTNNMTHIQASDGTTHWVPDVNAARKIDPGLKVIQ